MKDLVYKNRNVTCSGCGLKHIQVYAFSQAEAETVKREIKTKTFKCSKCESAVQL